MILEKNYSELYELKFCLIKNILINIFVLLYNIVSGYVEL